MLRSTLRNLGGSVVLAVPRQALKLVGLDAGSQVELSVSGSRIIIEPKKRPRYTLAELLARSKPADLAPSRSERRWLRDSPKGKELI